MRDLLGYAKDEYVSMKEDSRGLYTVTHTHIDLPVSEWLTGVYHKTKILNSCAYKLILPNKQFFVVLNICVLSLM